MGIEEEAQESLLAQFQPVNFIIIQRMALLFMLMIGKDEVLIILI